MSLPTRNDVAEELKWDLSSIIENDDKWEEIYNEVSSEYPKLSDYKGKLTDKNTILECLILEDEIGEKLERLYVYAKMKLDENAVETKYQALTDKAERLSVNISTLCSFIVPELTRLSEDTLNDMGSDALFGDFSYFLSDLARSKEHILSDSEEKILSETGSFSDGFHDAFNMFDNADVKFGTVNYNGEEIQLSHGTYSLCMQSADRDLREDAFNKMFNAYKKMINTITQLYAGNVKKNCFYARVRNYKSALSKSMFAENVPEIIYNNIIKSVEEGIPALHEYVEYRKKVLGFNELHMWDMHTPIVAGTSLELEYKDACDLVKKALQPLGEEYGKLLDKAFNERWIDVVENQGKRSGAYSWGAYNSHPYVLLNYQSTTHDVFTIAHELGHAMHSYYSNKNQPHSKAGYEIFVAEVASTVNEVLLLKYLINKSDKNTKKYLLSYYLDMFRTTLFRQTQFAEFEAKAHSIYENGESLTPEVLCDEYHKLNAKYYGNGVENDDLIRYEWARIPHFYRSFYVYKYATGITSAVVIANGILNDNSKIKNYMEFLSLGGSMPPSEILKVAGVNLESTDTYEIAMNEFKNTLNELRKMN